MKPQTIAASTPLSQEQFSKVAAALLGKARGEVVTGVDLNDRAQLLAFAQALVDGNTSDSSDGKPKITQKGPLPSASDSGSDEEVSDDEEDLARMLASVQRTSATAPLTKLKQSSSGSDGDDE